MVKAWIKHSKGVSKPYLSRIKAVYPCTDLIPNRYQVENSIAPVLKDNIINYKRS